MDHPLYAVITGDIRKSTRLPAADLVRLPDVLRKIFTELNLCEEKKGNWVKYSIFRGDSFQLLLRPESALKSALYIRAGLRSAYPTTLASAVDCRMAIAIDTIENLSENITESTGNAFTLSGRLLENIGKHTLMAIHTSDKAINDELNTELALCDEIVKRWTHSQALLVPGLINENTQTLLAESFDISQSAVALKVQKLGWQAISTFLTRFESLCNQIQQSDNYNA